MNTILWNSPQGLKLTVLSEDDDFTTVRSRLEEVHTDWRYIDTDIFPSDSRYGTEAYDWDNGLVLNISKVKELVKNRIRDEREEILKLLDIQFMRNLENDIDNTAIVAEKNRLRDLPDYIDTLTSIEELESVKV